MVCQPCFVRLPTPWPRCHIPLDCSRCIPHAQWLSHQIKAKTYLFLKSIVIISGTMKKCLVAATILVAMILIMTELHQEHGKYAPLNGG